MKNHARELYQCPKCSLTVEIASPCGCEEPCMRCCGEQLVPVKANTIDAAREKHVPVVSRTDNGIAVTVGAEEHPMTEKHHIIWIEASAGNCVIRKYLQPGDKPYAEFKICCTKDVTIRAYCNLHGLWENHL